MSNVSDAALVAAFRRVHPDSTFSDREIIREIGFFARAKRVAIKLLAEMIEKYEANTLVDPDLLKAREYVSKAWKDEGCSLSAKEVLRGAYDGHFFVKMALLVIKEIRKECEG